MTVDTNSYIPVTGDILLGSGIITRDNSGSGAYSQWRTIDYRIPCNKPSVAISMAHAWQLYRNIFKVKNYNINTFSGILINETAGGACQPPASLNFSCYPTSSFPFQNAYIDFTTDYNNGSGVAVSDGCYQIDGLGRLNLKEWYGSSECAIFSDLSKTESWITGNNIERNALARVYYDLAFSRRVQYVMGVDPLPVIASTNDPLGWYKVIAVAFNRGPGQIIPTVANRIFVTNRALAISSNDWFDPQLLGANGYAQACTHYVKILSNNYTPADGADQQKWTGWYDYNISWSEMDSYMTTIFVMYGLTPAEELTIRNKVKAAFDVQKDGSGKVAFKTKFGPVIDALVKALPYHEPTNTINNSQMGDAGCKGCVGPVVRIKANTPTKVCKGLSVELETVYGAGYTYYWLKDDVLVPNPNSQQHIFFASQSGVYDVVVKDNKGCAIRSDGAVTVTIDNTCSTCNLVANGAVTANSCSGIKDGKIVVALSGSDYNSSHTFSYRWTLPGGVVITQTSNTLNNISEGAYQLTVTDLSNSTCKAYQTFKVVETTPFYQSIDLTQSVLSCSSSKLTATVIDHPPTTCSYKVWLEGVPDGSGKCWGQTWSVSEWRLEIKTNGVSIGSNVPVFTNGVCATAQITFGANHGDIITVNFNNISSTAATGAFIYKLMDPKGNIITKNAVGTSFPGGSITNLITTTANCAQTTPAFSFTWIPSTGLTTPVNTSLTSNTTATVTANEQYIVEAVTSAAPSCKLRDTVIVQYTCTPTCSAPSTTPTFVSTIVSVCSPATGADVVATLPNGVYYQLFNSSTNAAIGTSAGPTASAGNVTFTNVAAGSYHVRIASSAANLTAATCYKASTTPVTVSITTTPSAPTTTVNPITYCQGATAAALTATGTNLKWYTVATLGTALAGAPTPLTTSTGTTSYWVSQTTGTCEGPRLKIDVTVNATPLAPTTTVNPVVYCQNATAAALTATGTNLKWYTVATLGTALAGAPTPLTTATGTTSYWVSSSTGSCEGPRLKIDVTVNATPSAPGVTPVAYCQNVIATALTATGTNLKWYTVATNGTALSGAPTPVTTTVGTTSYWVSSTLGSCEGPRTQIDVVVSTSLAAPTVTAVNYCQGATASALTAGGTNLKWYTDPVTGTGTTTAPTPLTTTVGLTSYYVSQVSGTCESPRAKLDVTINANPSAPGVSNPGAYCIGATASVLTATGTNLKWYDVATLGTALSGAPTPTTTASGTTSYYVSQTVVGCESPRAQIDVVVNAGPVAPTTATNPVVYCQNATASPLTATGTGLKWYDVATLGTALAGAPTPSTATSGSPVVSYWVSQTISGCEGARLQIDVNVVSSLGAPLTSNPAPYCQGATASALTASGTNLKWYTDPVTGTGTTTAPTPLTTTVGTTSYYVSEVSGTCESPRAKIDVIVTASPIAPLTSNPAPYCQGVTASALTATGTNLKWYTDPVTGTGSTTAPTPLTTTAGTTSYYVSQTSGTCESGRSKIDVIVNAIPVAPGTSSPSPYCVGGTAAVLTATGTNLLWYTINPGGIGSSTAPTPTTTSDGTTSYWVSQTVSGCESPRSKVDVTVNTTPSAPVVINPPAYCQGDIASQLTAVGASLLWYTDPISGTGNTSAPTPSTLIGGTTSYYVSLTLNGCEGQRAKIDVVVKPNPNKGLVVAGSDACLGTDATVTVQGSENGVTYEAYKDGVKIGTGSGNGGILSITVTTSNFVEGINTVNFKAIGCGSVDLDNKAEVVIIGKPEVISGPANAIICNNANTGLTYSISPVAGATSYLWSIDNEGKVNGSSTATTTSPDVSVDLTASNINPTNITVYAVTANGFKSCESSSAVIKQLQGYQPEDLLLSSDKICEGDEITFTISNPNAEYYLWDISTPATTVGTDGASEIVRRFDVAGSFTVTLTPSHPCKVPGSITPIVKNFTVSARPVAFAGNDTIMSAYTTIELNGTGSSVGNYTWTSDDGGASIENAGSLITKADFKGLSVVFTLTVSDPTGVAGCIATDSRTVELDVKVNHLPNAFSPNNDGNHDTYEIPNIEHYSKAMVYIYNQWGELIFKSEPGYPKAWDGKRNGKECEVGAYLMLIEFNQDSLPAIKETINLVK